MNENVPTDAVTVTDKYLFTGEGSQGVKIYEIVGEGEY